jgi:hypothetical protein
LRTDGFFIRAQSVIRADGFSSAQHRGALLSFLDVYIIAPTPIISLAPLTLSKP